MKCISYSLFGYNQNLHKTSTSFEFYTYMRGLHTNIRINRVLYPNWDIVVNIDANTYNSPFREVLDWHQSKGFIKMNLCDPAPLCLAMLWRLKPIFFHNEETGVWKYSHVICRDVDSVATYREIQAVDQWINEDKTIHCITDSISHNIPMMGGMVGMRPDYFTYRLDARKWYELMAKGSYNYSRKGTDQDFLNNIVYPKCYDSATEHFVLGMKRNIKEGDGRHYSIPDVDIDGVPGEYRDTNDLCGHIGSAGAYEPVLVKWLNTRDPYRDEYAEIERTNPQLFFWRVQ